MPWPFSPNWAGAGTRPRPGCSLARSQPTFAVIGEMPERFHDARPRPQRHGREVPVPSAGEMVRAPFPLKDRTRMCV